MAMLTLFWKSRFQMGFSSFGASFPNSSLELPLGRLLTEGMQQMPPRKIEFYVMQVYRLKFQFDKMLQPKVNVAES